MILAGYVCWQLENSGARIALTYGQMYEFGMQKSFLSLE